MTREVVKMFRYIFDWIITIVLSVVAAFLITGLLNLAAGWIIESYLFGGLTPGFSEFWPEALPFVFLLLALSFILKYNPSHNYY